MKPLRVLHVVGTSDVGGTERFLVRLLRRHRDLGSIESMVCVINEPGTHAHAYSAVTPRLEHLRITGFLSLARAVGMWRRILRGFDPDIIVLYGARANLLGRWVGDGRRRPVIMALRSTVVDDRGSRWSAWLNRVTFGRVTVCVSNSRSALESLARHGYPPEKLEYVEPDTDIVPPAPSERAEARRRLGVAEDELVILCVANLKPVKNHTLLLNASAALHARGLAHRLWLVGEGPDRPRLEAQAAALNLGERIVFTGYEADTSPRYAAADVFVLVSKWEGSPTAVLEAMTYGLPVVATPVGDVPFLVQDGVTGRLVEIAEPDPLADALMEAADPIRRSTWGAASAARSTSFSSDEMASRYAALFHRVAGREHGPPERFGVLPAPRRVVRIISRLNIGGPAIHVVLLAKNLSSLGFKTTLVSGAVGQDEGDMSYLLERHGVPLTSIPELGRTVRPFKDAVALVKLVRLLHRSKPEIVHTHASKAGALGRAAAVLVSALTASERRPCIVHTYHGHTFSGYFRPSLARVFRLIERALGKATDVVVVLSTQQQDDIVDRYRIVPRSKTRIVPLGLELDPFFTIEDDFIRRSRIEHGWPDDWRVVLAPGRLTAVKAPRLLLRAFASAAARDPRLHLVFAGDGELKQKLVEDVAELALTGRVEFLGWRTDMRSCYAASDVTTLASVNEGTPVVLIEAIASGCPVVATRVGGVPDVVDRSCGILVSAGDQVALSEGLLLGSRLPRLSRTERDTMRRFAVERLTADTADLYRSLLTRRRPGPTD
jgi:glycosyltransferase involved in cell wall biosynthesis